MSGKAAIDCDTSLAEEACTKLRWWIDAAEAGEMAGDEMLFRLRELIELIEDQRTTVSRALGF